jgi:hypothetical protein
MKNSKYTGKAVCALSCRQKNAWLQFEMNRSWTFKINFCICIWQIIVSSISIRGPTQKKTRLAL